MQNEHQPDKPYLLATGEKAVSRLALLERIFGPASRHLLSTAGLCSGMRVAEVGCGIGLTARWTSTQVSPGGFVAGVDSSSEQLYIAEKGAAEVGTTNLSFHEGNAYETGLPRDSFDLVYSRFLLCHLADPVKALTEMSLLLKRGGILVCEDHDDGGIFTEPATEAYKRLEAAGRLTRPRHWLDFVPFTMAHRPLKMTIEEAHAELNYGWAHSYSPEALAEVVAALDDNHVGDRVNIFLARLCFRGIYFPMMKKSSWLRVVVENRRTILRLFKEGLSRWTRPQYSGSRDSADVASPGVSGEANA